MGKYDKFKGDFDDIVKEGNKTWSQICQDCAEERGITLTDLDGAGMGICGIKGCTKEAEYYIDMN